ncbi:MAG: choice-of-anchor D domain-containing protein [Planctomycetota bacterium]
MFCAALVLGTRAASAQDASEDLPDGPKIKNPYYPNAKWRVWRDTDEPIEDVQTMVRQGKEKKQTTITLAPAPVAKRIYPSGPLKEGEPIRWETRKTPSTKFSGVWDDVYASWSGLHGYVRPTYQTTDGSAVHLRPKGLDHIMHFVEIRKTNDLLRCGINFVHQSTTGMSHTITNGYSEQMTTSYERIYFSDCLVTSPAHASYTEEWPDRTKDMLLALVPTLFNSVGSSNSETMAITKMMIAGGYLPPATKLTLKQNGLYPSALLYMWKASLPFEVPYDHELRHRIAYRALGHESQHRGKYGHAGGERGNLSLAYHRYDEIAHMRNMIRMAESMTVLPPEAILDDVSVEGGTRRYALKKTALVLQEKGEDVTIRVSSAKSYDLADRPLSVRWKLLYGNHATTCVPGEKADTWVIRVPWDDALPEGRTAIALIANNGVHDGNPAILNVYRKRGDLPPPGAGPGGYKYNSPHINRRPVLLGLQDQVVKPGQTVRLTLDAVDPEGQPVRFFKRAGEPGEIAGNLYTLKMPRGKSAKSVSATFIASDGTAGNSYAAKRVEFAVAPRVFAHIECKQLVGAAPFTINVSSKGSLPKRGKVEWGWEFSSPTPKKKPVAWKQMAHGATAKHTFKKPGLYEVALTVKSGETTDRETVQVWVTGGPPPKPVGGVVIEGNGVRIAGGDDSPCAFDHTQFGAVRQGARKRQQFMIFNRGKTKLTIPSKALTLEGPHAKEFRVAKRPATRIAPLGSTLFEIEFRPKGAGPRTAQVALRLGGKTIRFAVSGTGAAK